MWIETHAHLAIDRKRTYVGGFSGGGRAAVGLARAAEGAIAGVIGCGAGFPDAKTDERLRFPFFGTVGDRDFNYYEMRELDEALAKAKTRHRIAIFPGEHDWPPEDVAREALEWMDLQAARDGVWKPEAAALEGLYRAELSRARELESQARVTEAARRYAEIAADFEGLADVGEAKIKAEAFERDPSLQKVLGEERRRDNRDRRTLESLMGRLRAVGERDLPPAARLVGELQIAALKRQAEDPAAVDERLSAQRILANLRVQTSYYLPNHYLDTGDFGRALLMLSVAEAIDPNSPRVSYNRAAAHARAGQSAAALADLQRAVDEGFRAFDALETDPDFSRLRESDAYRKWIAQARQGKDASSP
jgi:tetratricopeptide (TPR) repeat protein